MTAHHLLFDKSNWEAQPAARRLRQMPQLIIPMIEEYHYILHREVVTIPSLDRHTASHTLNEFEPTQRYSKNIPRLLGAIERATSHPKSTDLQRMMGELTIYAIERTIPYIHMGMATDEVGGR